MLSGVDDGGIFAPEASLTQTGWSVGHMSRLREKSVCKWSLGVEGLTRVCHDGYGNGCDNDDNDGNEQNPPYKIVMLVRAIAQRVCLIFSFQSHQDLHQIHLYHSFRPVAQLCFCGFPNLSRSHPSNLSNASIKTFGLIVSYEQFMSLK